MLPENQIIRMDARERLKGNWGTPVLVTFLYILITGILSGPGGGAGNKENFNTAFHGLFPFLSFLISGPLTFGIVTFYLKFIRRETAAVKDLFEGFNFFFKTLALYFLTVLFVLLWSLLLIVPGIIAAIRYSQAFYLLRDDPELTPMKAIQKSKELMEGRKLRFFFLGLSFIGWVILSVITLGIGFLWVFPYMMCSFTLFYEHLISTSE